MELSQKMQQALSYAIKNGGSLRRYQGGYWAMEHWRWHEWPWFGTSTVEALVSRGVMSYSEWMEGRNGRFPVAAIIVETPNPRVQLTATAPEISGTFETQSSFEDGGN